MDQSPIHNQGPIQGQNIAQQQWITQHFYSAASEVAASVEPKRVWNIPYPHNPFFTGREQLLQRLAEAFNAGPSATLSQVQAISGLGGIGKTQIALEYAYQHTGDYQSVLWSRADSRESLISGFVALAELLGLPQKSEQDQALTIGAVKTWLQAHNSWLLILDNADDLSILGEFLPSKVGGHILLTTRAQSMGRLAKRIEVDTMENDMGALFLLRRANLIAEDASLDAAFSADKALAREICKELGGLPLALDQAGAFIEETQCSLSEYWQLYRTRRTELLKERGGLVADHGEGVSTTWSISFANVEAKNPAAADLLRFCAFLSPDAIPEEMIPAGAEHPGSHLQELGANPLTLSRAMTTLGAYSLIRRDASAHTLSVHRLVQVVLKDGMDDEMRKQWAERAVQAVSGVFPEENFTTWPQCERYLLHALVCAELVGQEQINNLEAARMFYDAGRYLIARARASEAYPLLQRALTMREHHLGSEHPDVASTIDRLAGCFQDQGKYAEAEALYLRTFEIKEKQLGAEHPDTAMSLNNLARLYEFWGRYAQAESLALRSLSIREQKLGPEHLQTAESLHRLSVIYRRRGKYGQAEPLALRSLAICEQQLRPEPADISDALSNLVLIYMRQGKYAEAEPLALRGLALLEQQLGSEHPRIVFSLGNLVLLYIRLKKYAEAEPLALRELAICEQQLGPEHPNTAFGLIDLALLYTSQGKYVQAEPLYQRALAIREQQLGPENLLTASSLHDLAFLYGQQGKYTEAEALFRRALSINKRQLGPEHPDTATNLHDLAYLYANQGKYAKAEALYQRALAIRVQQLGPEHPDTQLTQECYASLLQQRGT